VKECGDARDNPTLKRFYHEKIEIILVE